LKTDKFARAFNILGHPIKLYWDGVAKIAEIAKKDNKK